MNTRTSTADHAADASQQPHLPLQQAVERELRKLGYEICGDDDLDGWYWRLEDYDSRQTSTAEDRIEFATVAALKDLVARTQELLAAATVVVERWDRGDLAEAVRELNATLLAMRSDGASAEADTVAADEPSAVLDSGGIPIGHQAWLVCGTAPDGPWNEEAYLDRAAATARAREVAEVWQAEGLPVDLEQLETELASNRSYCPSDEFSVSLTCIEVIGDTALQAS